ncbi:type I-F CRISPR-associated protein Csy1 [Catenovulum adriaticum]|uniref:Type I-F CRISPR-associated protein Csy1 n=1 Tax=Catenovulum adriaticum TaxID=2984846 RepID=A0ABY7AP26_9ALTE|nr:type I-F CRISPR-associated protein Csy1 [Catenovulum sp. TS8]WAJ71259.1 type I-F CRISPR-associated protein Csy1 [Catenovulum sp. TS8]
MLDPTIQEFLQGRIDRRVEFKCKEVIKKNGVIDESEKLVIENSAKDEYNLKNWLLYCAKNANGVSMTTHPCKYSHPDAQTTSIYFNKKVDNKGFVQSSISNNTDVLFSTAAYMPIYSFLRLVLIDGKDILEHLMNDSEVVRKQFSIVDDYDLLKTQLLEVISNNTDVVTSEKVKQVYFPVYDDYHLLSVVSSSIIMFDLKKRIKHINSFEINESKIKAKKDNLFCEGGYKTLFDLTIQGHVKSNPQCISQLNKDNFGESYLLSSCPPCIEKRNVHFPKSDFFIESFKKYEYADNFKALHKLFKTDYNNIKLRDARDRNLQQIIDLIIEKMWSVRAVSQAQFHADTSSLSSVQMTWLHSDFADEREKSEQWLNLLITEISTWLTRSYEKVLDKKAIKLGDAERLHFAEVIERNREFLK